MVAVTVSPGVFMEHVTCLSSDIRAAALSHPRKNMEWAQLTLQSQAALKVGMDKDVCVAEKDDEWIIKMLYFLGEDRMLSIIPLHLN